MIAAIVMFAMAAWATIFCDAFGRNDEEDSEASGRVASRKEPSAKGEPEPTAWTIEVKHKNAHKKGAPGIIGFSPQSLFRVYMDNISITNN